MVVRVAKVGVPKKMRGGNNSDSITSRSFRSSGQIRGNTNEQSEVVNVAGNSKIDKLVIVAVVKVFMEVIVLAAVVFN